MFFISFIEWNVVFYSCCAAPYVVGDDDSRAGPLGAGGFGVRGDDELGASHLAGLDRGDGCQV